MPVKVECESCKAPYTIDERRIPAAGLRVRCPKCTKTFVVKKPDAGPASAAPPATQPATPAAVAEAARAHASGPTPGESMAKLPAIAPEIPQPSLPPTNERAKPAAAFDADLPAPADAALLPSVAQRPGGKAPLKPVVKGTQLGLGNFAPSVIGAKPPETKPEVKPVEAKPIAAPAAPKVEAHADLDLPATRPSTPKAFGEIDLPAPAAKADLPAARPAAPARPAAAKPFGEVEFPAPKGPPAAAPTRPAIPRVAPPAAAAPAPTKKTAPGFDDLPAVPTAADLPAVASGARDLPATKPTAPARPAAATKMQFGEIDLPAVGARDLPAVPSGARDLPAVPSGARDLPAVPSGARDLPAVATGPRDLPAATGRDAVKRTAAFGELDLPAVGAPHLPAVRAPGADLPELAGAHLPAIAAPGANLPSPVAHQNLPSPREPSVAMDPTDAFGELGSAQTLQGPGYSGGGGSGFGELELPGPGAHGDAWGGPDLGAPPAARSFGEVDLGEPMGTSPRAATGVGASGVGTAGYGNEADFGDLNFGNEAPPAKPAAAPSLAPMGAVGGGSTDFGELELPGPGASLGAAPAHGDFGAVDHGYGDVGLGSVRPPEASSQRGDSRGDGGMGFGEVDLGGGGGGGAAVEDDMEFGAIPQEKRGGGDLPSADAPAAYEAPLPKPRAVVEEPVVEKKPSNAGRIAAAVFALLLLGGAALQFDDRLGAFGWKAITDKVNEGKYAQTFDAAVKRTRQAFGEDTAPRANAALDQLHADVQTAPRYAPLVAYDAYAQFAYELRFGKDAQRDSLARAALAKVSQDVPQKKLAEAARDVVAGQLPPARSALASLLASDPKNVDAAVTLGELELGDKKPKEAIAAFEKATKIEDSPRTRGGLMRAYDAAGDVANAKKEATALAAKVKTNGTARLLLAKYAWEGDRDEAAALKWLDEIESPPVKSTLSTPELIDALTLRGTIDLDRGRFTKARTSFQAAIDAAKGNPAPAPEYGLGEYFMANGQYPQAVSHFQEAAKLAPDMTLAKIGVARAQLKQDKGAEAKATLAPLKDPKLDGEIGYWRGQAEEKINPDKPNDAIKIYEAAIKAQPNEVKPYVALANLQAKIGKIDAADATLAQASKSVPPSERLHLAMGDLRFRQERYTEALDHFDKALELQPNNLEAMFAKAKTLLRMGDAAKWEDGKKVLDEVSAKDSSYPGVTLEYGLYYQKTGKLDEAIAQYNQALAKNPKDVDIQLQIARAKVEARVKDVEENLRDILSNCGTSASQDVCATEARHYLGRALLNNGKAPEAKIFLDQALAKGDNNAQYHLYDAWAQLETGDLVAADREIARTLDLDKSLGLAYWLRSEIELKSGKNKDAIDSARKALSITSSLYSAHATIGLAQRALGNEELAVPELTTAIKADPTNPKAAYWRYVVADIRFHQDETALATQEIKDAIKQLEALDVKPPYLAKLYFYLGEALRRSDKKAAVDAYRKYVDMTPGGTDPARKEAMAAISELAGK